MRLENVQSYDNKGLEALLFSSQGDLRHAMNNLQSTVAGFGTVTADNVFKVVDQPHPVTVTRILESCLEGDINSALILLMTLTDQGYAGIDIIGTIFRVAKNLAMDERKKLEYIKVSQTCLYMFVWISFYFCLSFCLALRLI